MNWYEAIVIYILLWGFLDRLREIAGWIHWQSIFGPWFDTVNEVGSKWWPFRDGYHTFKGLAILILCGIVGYYAGILNGIYAYAAWATGQYIGKLTKRR